MIAAESQRRLLRGALLAGVVAALIASALATSAAAEHASTVACPLTAADVGGIVGRTVQRVNLSDTDGSPTDQCAFSSISRTTGLKRPPQVFLNVDPGGATELRDLYSYYLGARNKLATRPRVSLRPDLGAGAFTLSATTLPVTSAFFLIGKNGVGTLTVDLTGAPVALRDADTADQIFSLVHDRLH